MASAPRARWGRSVATSAKCRSLRSKEEGPPKRAFNVGLVNGASLELRLLDLQVAWPRRDRPRHAAFLVAFLPVPLHCGHSSTMRSSYMGPGTYADPWHSGHAFSARSCLLFHVLCTVLPSLEWLPAVRVRTFDEERACSRGWLGRRLVVCDHRADVIGRSKVTVDIAVRSVHGPVSNQLCRIHPGCAPQ